VLSIRLSLASLVNHWLNLKKLTGWYVGALFSNFYFHQHTSIATITENTNFFKLPKYVPVHELTFKQFFFLCDHIDVM
jgi:hypothetical protein